MRTETIIEPDKRFVTIKEYCRRTGLSYAAADHMLKTGQLNYITTEGGLRRIDTKEQGIDNAKLTEEMEKIRKMLTALVKQFNTEVK